MTPREIMRAGLAALVALAAGWTATGVTPAAAKDLYPLTFQLNFPGAGFHAGFALAAQKGFYRDAGLDVKIESGNGSQITAELLAAGKVDVGFADASAVMKLISAGARMRIIATILQGNPNDVIALKKTGLKSVADLKGKSVGVPNGGMQAPMLPVLFAANGLKETDMQLIYMPPDSLIPSLLQGQVQVIMGSIDYYAINLKNFNAETDDFPFIDHGAPTISTSIVGTNSFLAAHPDLAKAFVAASLKGWSAAIDDGAAAVAAVKTMFPDASEKLAPAQLDATRYLCARTGRSSWASPFRCNGTTRCVSLRRSTSCRREPRQRRTAHVRLSPARSRGFVRAR